MIDELLREICFAMTIMLCDQPKEEFTRMCINERDQMKLLTKDIEKKLIANYETNKCESGKNREHPIDHLPVVKFFGGSACTWLITEYNPNDNMFFGLCDLGLGCPEMGYVSRTELETIRFKPFNLPIERDRHWTADKTLSQYLEIAQQKGMVEA